MKSALQLYWGLLVLSLLGGVASGSPWQDYILAPPSRTVLPTSVYRKTGNVTSSYTKLNPRDIFRLTGPNASVTFDFGQMTAGIPTIDFRASSCNGQACSTLGLPGFSCGNDCQGLGVGYTESARFIRPASDNSTYYGHLDGILYVPITKGVYTVPPKWGRGGFRYLTLSLGAQASPATTVELQLSHIYFTADPNQDQLQAYSSYFWSSDELLNRIWYAGVYTVQLCTVAANSSVQHSWLLESIGWSAETPAAGLSSRDAFLADGAKRDRNPWAGDLDVALRSVMVSQVSDKLLAVRNSLQEIIILQDPVSGYFPYAGSPLGEQLVAFGISAYGSDTYNLWTIAVFAEYVLASGDVAFGKQHWLQIVRALKGTYPYVNPINGLFNGSRTLDWGRVGQGGQNIALNALYYHTLQLTARVSGLLSNNSTMQVSKWQSMAAKVKASANQLLFDRARGMFYDNTTTAGHQVYPQDGNVAAINFNLTSSPAQALAIAEKLSNRLTRYGNPAPELPGSISPFIGSQELRAQFAASPANATRALALLRTQWGYMLNAFSNTTFIEGYYADGSLGYGFYPSGEGYVSHAHAWSTGPVYSLLSRVVGLRASAIDLLAEDGNWVFQPAVVGSGLTFAQGGFSTKDGKFVASWKVNKGRLSASVSVPAGSSGTIYVPVLDLRNKATIKLDGEKVRSTNPVEGFVRCANVAGGPHSIEVY